MNLQLLETKSGRQFETVQVVKSLEQGIPTSAINEIALYLDIPINGLIKYLHISNSTWHRRKNEGKLDFNLSDKVLQVSKLLEHAENVFGNSKKVRSWFKTPSIVFEQLLPVELIGSLSGIILINDELTRIEHGVFI